MKDNINMRGFDVQGSIFKDGIRDLSKQKRYDNTEELKLQKGVGSDNGRGVSSGYINQVSKTAKNVDEASGTAGYSTKKCRLTADLNKALSETRSRLNVLKQKGCW
ncbi:hypothetical protein [Aliarcobacter butzleri]|uniref:hypothetical protein n=1 Tax=Aliarcobacter butzleri TaxID=28197 RepID=UPI003AFAA117